MFPNKSKWIIVLYQAFFNDIKKVYTIIIFNFIGKLNSFVTYIKFH